jgi:hypothetical protein
VRNQRLKASQVSQQLEPDRSGLQSNAHPDDMFVWGTLRLVSFAGLEAVVNACGVTTAMLQGHSWAPSPSQGSLVNVGTIPLVPDSSGNQPGDLGKARCRLMPEGWDGGPVVVRGRESRPHGKGAQCVRSDVIDRGDRW